MKYICTHITKNGLDEYTLRIEESTSFLDRFLFSKPPVVHIIHGRNMFWEYSACGIRVPAEIKEFANQTIKENGRHL
jgi:hypothetical protein